MFINKNFTTFENISSICGLLCVWYVPVQLLYVWSVSESPLILITLLFYTYISYKSWVLLSYLFNEQKNWNLIEEQKNSFVYGIVCLFSYCFIFLVPIEIWLFSETSFHEYPTFFTKMVIYLGEELSSIMLKGLSIIVGVLLIKFLLLIGEWENYHKENQGVYLPDIGKWHLPKSISDRREKLQFCILVISLIYNLLLVASYRG